MCKESYATPCKNCGLLIVADGCRGRTKEFCSGACHKEWSRRKVKVRCPHCKKACEVLFPRTRDRKAG